jgi:hypothetical protein
MTRLADVPEDPVIVVVGDEEPAMSLEQWLMLLEADEPTDVDAGAAEVIREIREYGER